MSTSNCFKCNQRCVFKEDRQKDQEHHSVFGFPCDMCFRTICQTCNNNQTQEISIISSPTRTLIHLCPDCYSEAKQLPKIFKQIEDLKSEITVLRDEIKKSTEISFTFKGDIEDMITKALEKYSEETCATLRVLAHGIKDTNKELVKSFKRSSHRKENLSKSAENIHRPTPKTNTIEVERQSKQNSKKEFKKISLSKEIHDDPLGITIAATEGAIKKIATAGEKRSEETGAIKKNLARSNKNVDNKKKKFPKKSPYCEEKVFPENSTESDHDPIQKTNKKLEIGSQSKQKHTGRCNRTRTNIKQPGTSNHKRASQYNINYDYYYEPIIDLLLNDETYISDSSNADICALNWEDYE